MGIVWEIGFGVFLLVTVVLGGGAAYLTGRAVALTWRAFAQLGVYVLLLSVAVRFIHFALFGGTFFQVHHEADGTVSFAALLTALHYWFFDMIVLLAFAWLGFRATRARQMVGQYSWIYERSGGLGWRKRAAPAPSETR